jgi:hypothetical protein
MCHLKAHGKARIAEQIAEELRGDLQMVRKILETDLRFPVG